MFHLSGDVFFFFHKQLFHGTPVTIENFLNWKAKFDAELLEIKKKRMKEEEQTGKNELSRRQLFETDHNLDTSDIQFLEDGKIILEFHMYIMCCF